MISSTAWCVAFQKGPDHMLEVISSAASELAMLEPKVITQDHAMELCDAAFVMAKCNKQWQRDFLTIILDFEPSKGPNNTIILEYVGDIMGIAQMSKPAWIDANMPVTFDIGVRVPVLSLVAALKYAYKNLDGLTRKIKVEFEDYPALAYLCHNMGPTGAMSVLRTGNAKHLDTQSENAKFLAARLHRKYKSSFV